MAKAKIKHLDNYLYRIGITAKDKISSMGPEQMAA